VGKSAVERRKHKRHAMGCSAALETPSAGGALRSKAVDVSDGGALLVIPIARVPRVSERVKVVLSLPRSTPNTYMVEEVACEARVIRHQPMQADDVVGVGLQFTPVQNLGLEV
jgi:c-di-GMP-binding flagellar brake protein YcgR